MSSPSRPATAIQSDAPVAPASQTPLPPMVRLPTAALPHNLYAVVPSLALLTLGFGADFWDLIAETDTSGNGHRPR